MIFQSFVRAHSATTVPTVPPNHLTYLPNLPTYHAQRLPSPDGGSVLARLKPRPDPARRRQCG